MSWSNPTVQVDCNRSALQSGDTIIQCSDGLYACMTEADIRDTVNRMPPADACDYLVRLAEKRGSQDNISVQIVRADSVPRVAHYRGTVAYYAPAAAAAPSTQELGPGSRLDERFEILDVISRTNMSSVFKARDLKTGRLVALKVPDPQLEADAAAFTFSARGEIGLALHHPNILQIIPVDDRQKSRPYLVMELLEGQTLERLMHEINPLPERDALAIVSQVCEALSYLHAQGVVHRDLKPQNIMLCNDGSLRIMDFGIAKAASGRRITFGGFSPTMGTPDYMAPEQVKGQRGDERTDLYSLGAILYEILTGRVLFRRERTRHTIMNARVLGDPPAPRTRNPQIRPQVEEIMLHAMARDPADRYPSAAAMKADVDAPDQVEVTGRAARLQAPKASSSRWRKVRTAIIVALMPIALFLLLWFLLSRRH